MKVEKITPAIGEYVVMDDGVTYRRSSSESWEELMGESFEDISHRCQHHEAAYQAAQHERSLKTHNDAHRAVKEILGIPDIIPGTSAADAVGAVAAASVVVPALAPAFRAISAALVDHERILADHNARLTKVETGDRP